MKENVEFMLTSYDLICKKLFRQTYIFLGENEVGGYTYYNNRFCRNFCCKQFPPLRCVMIMFNFLTFQSHDLQKEIFPFSIYFVYYDYKSTFESTCQQLSSKNSDIISYLLGVRKNNSGIHISQQILKHISVDIQTILSTIDKIF